MMLVTQDKNGKWHFGLDAPSSLVIGGFDENRCNFSRTDQARFKFSRRQRPYDHFRIPNMQIQFNASDIPQPLNFSLQDVLIDTATPFIWLPSDIYNSIQESMGVISNTSFGVNFLPINNTNVNTWKGHQLKINFIIPSALSTSQAPSIISADPADWWKKITPPFTDTGISAKTVPIAMLPNNQTTPVLGLSFFTYACMLANYDDETFAITSQGLRYDGATKIKSISENFAQKPPKASSKILAIAISLSVLVVLVIGLVGCLIRKRTINKQKQTGAEAQAQAQAAKRSVVTELESPTYVKLEVAEKDSQGAIFEIGGSSISEMQANGIPVEIDGKEHIPRQILKQ
jgi:hypothetical protein